MGKIWGSVVNIAQLFIREVLYDGSVAVDATVGNGGDTLFLAGAVGDSGLVYGFDIQEKAIEITSKKLSQCQLLKRVEFFNIGHENMLSFIKSPVDAIMFNLGYLPGGDHGIITRAETTVDALSQGLELLSPGGRLSIAVYTGHAGAQEEYTAVEKYVSNLENKMYNVIKLNFINRKSPPPFLILIEKEGSGCEK
ncbi:tRNA (mnm(5)s(2)U34)-methyltransferase [Desulfolucanica intricata]|uniref:tRNA (mnm(5)s(2)U34)-methyltransferase n=1 Tax=Desulfolucanica intricata TaxID=1285191 RepID=UPI000836148E|nr:class I SAM-dependent methyltransferase [Desulfolucanica intricata]